MTCSQCLDETPELQTLTADGVCPRCGVQHVLPGARIAAPTPSAITGGWAETHKLTPTGDAYRDRLVKARLALRSSDL